MRTPKIVCQKICSECQNPEGHYIHRGTGKFWHKPKLRLETEVEAAYRQGYKDGAEYTADKIHWGIGWD